jgi:hypothetical protein
MMNWEFKIDYKMKDGRIVTAEELAKMAPMDRFQYTFLGTPIPNYSYKYTTPNSEKHDE